MIYINISLQTHNFIYILIIYYLIKISFNLLSTILYIIIKPIYKHQNNQIFCLHIFYKPFKIK